MSAARSNDGVNGSSRPRLTDSRFPMLEVVSNVDLFAARELPRVPRRQVFVAFQDGHDAWLTAESAGGVNVVL